MSADEYFRAAADRAILRERLRLHAHFAAPVAAALGQYHAETLERGLPSEATRRALADLLAPYGLADPDGTGRLPPARVPDVGKPDPVVEEYRRADLRGLGVGVDVFRAEHARRNRESPRPITPAEVAAALARDAVPERPGAPLRLLEGARRVIRRSTPRRR